jgi:putative chitinase
MIRSAELREIVPGIKDIYIPMLKVALREFEIITPLRQAAFIAHIALELQDPGLLREYWGPTRAQLQYEPPTNLSKELGNMEWGDGKLYRGRGFIRLRGRGNYKLMESLLGFEFEGDPNMASVPVYAVRIAGCYWQYKKCNILADEERFDEITRILSGHYTELAIRQGYYEKAKRIICCT